jgi:predicted AAA+ superfamily ATPase
MLAHNQGQMVNAARLAAGLAVSGQTVERYVSILTGLFLTRRLTPWTGNLQKRLVRSPKLYVRDSGLVHALLGIRGHEDLLGHPVVGSSWEGFMIENIAEAVADAAQLSFYRSATGAEIDLILEFTEGDRWAIEIKRSLSPTPSKGFYIGCEDIQATRRFVLYPGKERYSIGATTEAIPLDAFVELIISRRG